MKAILKYRGRVICDADIDLIGRLIEEHSKASRRELSRKLCERWNWVQANGALCDMVCRGLLLALERAGQITLPPAHGTHTNPLVVRRRPDAPAVDASSLAGSLNDLGPLEFRLVRRTAEEQLFNGLIEHHHYLGYTQPVGPVTFCYTSLTA